MNKDLYGKYHDVPENILNNLKKYSNEKTIAKILEDKKVSYSNLKKILHDMEVFKILKITFPRRV